MARAEFLMCLKYDGAIPLEIPGRFGQTWGDVPKSQITPQITMELNTVMTRRRVLARGRLGDPVITTELSRPAQGTDYSCDYSERPIVAAAV
jgi:hypothetical protein